MSEQPAETEIETVEAPQFPYDPAPEPPDDNDDAINDGVEGDDEDA
jgi:hypothetical protein